LLGAGALVLVSGREIGGLLGEVEWGTLVFFGGLFIMVGALVKVGVIEDLAEAATRATGGSAFVAAMLILLVSGTMSGFVDNIPFAAAAAPLVGRLTADLAVSSGVLWWALALGTDLGGNATAVGASANVIVVGLAERAGHRIRFVEFLKYGALATAASLAVSAGYLWIRYFVLG
jgi:Na+/H+ antiporter NhaD/arsenite permease-like protein